MPNKINEVGNKYGRLTVIAEAQERSASGGGVKWVCQCDCGNMTTVLGTVLRKGLTQSCGCYHADRLSKNEIGKKYGKLTVIDRAPNHKNRAAWICQCECGKIVTVTGTNLRQGTSSCGCALITNKRLGQRYGKLTVIKQLPDNIWQCQCDCGNIIETHGRYLDKGHKTSCGCLRSYGEQRIMEILSNMGIMFEKEKIFKECKYPWSGGNCRFDFYLPKYNCVIEYDGMQHYTGWGNKTEDLEINQKRDQFKQEWCDRNCLQLIRIPYTDYDILNVDYIKNKLQVKEE